MNHYWGLPKIGRNALIWAVTVLTLSSSSLLAEQIKLQPIKDTTIYEDVEGALSNGSGDYFFTGVNGANGGNAIMRALIAFDLSSIPANAVIENVTLQMQQGTPRNDTTQREVSLHRAQSEWGEASSNAEDGEAGGAPAADGDATWLHRFFSNTLWTNPGGDFDNSASASTPVGPNDYYQWSSEQMVADVQAWVDDPSSNFGWLLKGQESLNGAINTAKRFTSREAIAVNTRPELTVDYSEKIGPDIVFPQFVSGDGNSSRWIIRNNSDTILTGRISFVDPNGEETQVPIDGSFTDRVSFSLEPWASLDVSSDSDGRFKAGAAEVYIESGSASDMEAAEIFFVLGNYVSVTGARPDTEWQAYVSRNDSENAGIAIQNPDRTSAAVMQMTLLNSSGAVVATDELTLQPGQRISQFLGESNLFQDYFEQNPGDFAGTLNLEVTAGEDVALVGLIQKLPSGELIAIEATNNPFVSPPQQ
jgi:hypothetical protein